MRFAHPLRAGLFTAVTLGALGALAAACGSGKSGTQGTGGTTTGTTSTGTTTGGSTTTGTTSSGTTTGDGGPGAATWGEGAPLQVAPGVEVCLPPVVCTAETCPPPLGQCVGGKCVFGSGYQGVKTLPEAWATHYCALSMGGCHGVTQIDFPEKTARPSPPRWDTRSATSPPRTGASGSWRARR